MIWIVFEGLGSVRGDWGGKVKVKDWKRNRGIVDDSRGWRGRCCVCSM